MNSLLHLVFYLTGRVSLQTLEVLLREWKKDESNKVLIFTKSVKLLEMLEFHLNSKGLPKSFSMGRCVIRFG
jgi:SNF2 family DNA or RNA helicase